MNTSLYIYFQYLSTSVESKSKNLTRVCEATRVVGTHANLEIQNHDHDYVEDDI